MMTSRALALLLSSSAVAALPNGLALTPPMGWMTWERFRCTIDCDASPSHGPSNCINEDLIRQHADILAQPEWRSAGYRYVNIDDCWENLQRTADGKIAPNTTRFPHGMAELAKYVHAKGLRLGTYNDMGTQTCGHYPGECKDPTCSLPGYMTVDANTYAAWGIDSLKMDGCNSYHTHEILDPAYIFMGDALNKTGRPVLYSCSWPDYIRTNSTGTGPVDYKNTAKHCNLWRMYSDIQDSWVSVTGIIDWVGDNAPKNGMLDAAGPGHWNDPDMLIIGNFGLSYEQSKTQMALWSMMAAPLLMGNDLRNLAPEMKSILLAPEVIEVDQDPLGRQGWRVAQDLTNHCTAYDIWMRPLAGGDIGVVIWNRGDCGAQHAITLQWEMLSLPATQPMALRDLYERKELGTHTGHFQAWINPQGPLMLRMRTVPKLSA
jgi:alpha-N-acetylgalactosaminidase